MPATTRSRAAALAWVVVVTYGVLLVAAGPVPGAVAALFGVALAWVPPAVGLLAVRGSARGSGLRVVVLALALFSAGLSANGIAFALTGTVPFPALGDLGYVGFYVAISVGLVRHVKPRVPRLGFFTVLDAAVALLAIATVLSLLLTARLEARRGLTAPLVVALSYPFADLALLCSVVGLVVVTPQALRAWWWLAAGFLLLATSDMAFALGDVTTMLQSSLQVGWGLGLMSIAQWLVTVGDLPPHARRDSRYADGGESRRTARGAALSAGVAAAALIGVVLRAATVRLDPLTAALAASMTLATALRTQFAFGLLAAEPRLRAQARTDELTGLPNRRELTERAERVLGGTGRQHAVLVLDLDGFKKVNDTRGHHAGDVLLAEAARRISSAVRLTDVVARTGGDEFAVLMPDASATVAVDAVERIRRRFGEPFVIEGTPAAVTTSVGVALYPEHGTDMTTLVRRADAAMYAAKAAGASYRVAGPEHDGSTPPVPGSRGRRDGPADPA